MPKNIVICCDGTENKLTINENTNVIHLYSCLAKNNDQVTYYHPGVGTMAPDGIRNAIKRNLYTFTDKLFATSLEHNVKSAYLFLMNHYEEGDKIYLFGFSRGAYTVRKLSGMIHLFGLLHKGNEDNLKYALEIYHKRKKLFHLANSFKVKFSKEITIHFVGIWDTVVAAGGLFQLYTAFPFSGSMKNVAIVRHAVAIDERRKHYDYYPVHAEHENVKEVYFSGVHSDIGGSYPEEGLSKLALEWMIGEASQAGVHFDKNKVNQIVYGEDNRYQPSNYMQPTHNSLTFKFIISDFLPRLRFKKRGTFKFYFDFRLWPKRYIPSDAYLHESVFYKLKNDVNYKPKNLSADVSEYKTAYNETITYYN